MTGHAGQSLAVDCPHRQQPLAPAADDVEVVVVAGLCHIVESHVLVVDDIQPVAEGTRKVFLVELVLLVVNTAVLVVGMVGGTVEVDVDMVLDWVKHHLMVEGR